MKKRGFTLIELLAVIVVLAIIALIATPIVMNIIKDAKEESNKRSIEMYAKALELSIAQHQLENNGIPIGKYTTTDGRNLVKVGETEPSLIVDYNGDVVFENIIVNHDGTFHISECEINGNPIDYEYGILYPEAFSTDRWDVIASNINSSVYNVGDTREIEMDVDGDGIKETYTVRIANLPSQQEIEDGCGTEGFSETACGFVVEFVDIITKLGMKTYHWGPGAYPNNLLHSYLNNDLYNLLPEDLKTMIKKTKVVSSHTNETNESREDGNFESNDILFLLTSKEVNGSAAKDFSSESTRQLDYYKYKATTSADKIKQYNGENTAWWLRSVDYTYPTDFHYINISGGTSRSVAGHALGVSPAFRIGK